MSSAMNDGVEDSPNRNNVGSRKDCEAWDMEENGENCTSVRRLFDGVLDHQKIVVKLLFVP